MSGGSYINAINWAVLSSVTAPLEWNYLADYVREPASVGNCFRRWL